MRLILITTLVALAAGCARHAGFSDDVRDAATQAAALRKGFESIASLPPGDKGAALERVVDATAKPLLARLEALTPPAGEAECAANALGGARRSVGAMQDMVKLYAGGHFDDLFGARIVASARNADQGLVTVEDELRACAAR